MLDPPEGWGDRAGFLSALGGALQDLHGWRSHPLGQSVQHGSQTSIDLAAVQTPVIRALFATLPTLIDAHIARLGHGSDPVRRLAPVPAPARSRPRA